jgi:putative ABC transport system permease protein
MSDLRSAFRQLLKAPALSATVIFALALGIGATTAIYAVIYAFLLRPLPFAQPEQLVMLQSRSTQSGGDLGVNYLDFRDWQKAARSFSAMAFFNLRWNGNVESPDGTTETLKTTFTTANLFQLLGVAPTLGRDFRPADDEAKAPPVVLISYRLWQRTFGGDAAIIGRQIRLDGDLHTVVGIMPQDFRFPAQTDLWVPMASVFGKTTNRGWRLDQAIGRLNPGATAAQARAELGVIAQRLAREHPDTNTDVGSEVVPLRDQWVGDVRSSLLLLFAACGGVLLISCTNVSQLLLARAVTRGREFSIRVALGASRLQLVRQLLTESALLALLGSAAGVLLAIWLVDFVAAAIPVELPFWIRINLNPSVLAFTLVVSSVAGLLAGLLPVGQATRLNLSDALKTSGAGSTGGSATGRGTREILMVAQIAISTVLLVGASLVLRSVINLHEVNPGFDPRQVLMMEVNPTYNSSESTQVRVDRFNRILARIAQIPEVEAVAANNSPPFVPQRPWNRTELTAEHQSIDEQARNPRANFQTVSEDYFRALRIPLLRGRLFEKRDNLEAPHVCIISERLAISLWPASDAVGQRIRLGNAEDAEPRADWITIVGVVRDVRHQALEAAPGPDFYQPSRQLAWKQMHFLVRTRAGIRALTVAPTIRKEVAGVAPEVGVFNFVSLEDEVGSSFWQSRLRGWLLGFFSIVTLVLAAAGLYATMVHEVTQRTREIGIRMALGATPARVLRLVVGQGMCAVVVGMFMGVGGALMLAQFLRASLFGVGENDLSSYAAACGFLGLVALITNLIPAHRATRINPVQALHTE